MVIPAAPGLPSAQVHKHDMWQLPIRAGPACEGLDDCLCQCRCWQRACAAAPQVMDPTGLLFYEDRPSGDCAFCGRVSAAYSLKPVPMLTCHHDVAAGDWQPIAGAAGPG